MKFQDFKVLSLLIQSGQSLATGFLVTVLALKSMLMDVKGSSVSVTMSFNCPENRAPEELGPP